MAIEDNQNIFNVLKRILMNSGPKQLRLSFEQKIIIPEIALKLSIINPSTA